MPTTSFDLQAYSRWLARCIPCKIGTVPMVVQVSSRKKVKVGKDVLIKEDPAGAWVQRQSDSSRRD